MKVININNRKYIIGLEWEVYSNVEEAKNAVQDEREEGKVSGMIPLKDKGIYLVYKGERLEGKTEGKYYILATGFLHKKSGAYYMPLTENTVWLLVKGVDESVLFDGEVAKEEMQYKAIEYGMNEVLPISEKDIQKPIAYSFGTQNKKLYMIVGSIVIFFVIVLFAKIFGSSSSTPSSGSEVKMPSTFPSISSLPIQPSEEKFDELFVIHFDFKRCYEEYYRTLKDTDCSSERYFNSANEYMNCDELMEQRLPFRYGEVKDYGNGVFAYPFSLAGNFYYHELKDIQGWTFAKEGFSFKIMGHPKNLNVVWTGVVLCK